MMPSPRLLWELCRHFGPGWVVYRTGYALRARAGLLRRKLPAAEWACRPLGSFIGDAALVQPEAYLDYRRVRAPRFFVDPALGSRCRHLLAAWDSGTAGPVAIAEDVAQGKLRYFGHAAVSAGFPPDWHTNPFTGQHVPAGRHWSEISDSAHGDMKIVWEPSRFAFAYALVRAYWRTGDERWPELFWQLVQDWQARNPPQQGPGWMCGQEISLRVMAWCFGLYGFLHAPATTARRVEALAQMVALSGERIAANLGYALHQRNNHGISEGMGLWTIGVLFPELRPAAAWRERGRQVLESQGRELIYDDGSFAQHSVNYHRLVLHAYLWSLRLGDIQGRPFSRELKERVAWAGGFLYQMQDQQSGGAPCYGHNDGALILPLSNCDYQDFRPVVQVAQYYATGTRAHPPGPWDEDLLWLFGPEAMGARAAPPARHDLRARTGGYHTLRSSSGFAFVRCATYRHRPGQADMLHVDLWWRGQNLALDPGTYSYNAPAPWENALAATAYHNTVMVDGLDQMERAGRFLWLPWLRGRLLHDAHSQAGHLAYWEGEHDAYRRLAHPVRCRRGIVRLGEEHWLVVDALTSPSSHRYRLHWLLADLPYTWEPKEGRLALTTPSGPWEALVGEASGTGACSLIRADDSSPRGWRSPYYACREPALSMDLAVRADAAVFWTLLGAGPCWAMLEGGALRVQTERWRAFCHLGGEESQPLVTSVAMDGAVADRLSM